MRSLLIRWVLPNPIDLLILIVTVMIGSVLFWPFLGEVTRLVRIDHENPHSLLIGAIQAGLAAVLLYLGMTYRHRVAWIPLGMMMFALLVLVPGVYFGFPLFDSIHVFQRHQSSFWGGYSPWPSPESINLFSSLVKPVLWSMPILFLVGTVLPQAAIFIKERLTGSTQGSQPKFQLTRPKILIVIAVVLIVGQRLVESLLMNKAIAKAGFNFQLSDGSQIAAVLTFAVLMYYSIGWLLCSRTNMLAKLSIAIAVMVVCWITLYQMRHFVGQGYWSTYGVWYSLFILILLGLGWASQQPQGRGFNSLPSIWGAFLLSSWVLGCWGLQTTHIPAFIKMSLSSSNYALNWENARQLRKLERDFYPELKIDWEGQGVLSLGPQTASDVLAKLQPVWGSQAIAITGLQPRFETTDWNLFSPSSVLLTEGQITGKQFGDLAQCQYMRLNHIELVDPVDDLKLGDSLGRFSLYLNLGGEEPADSIFHQLSLAADHSTIDLMINDHQLERRFTKSETLELLALSKRCTVKIGANSLANWPTDLASHPDMEHLRLLPNFWNRNHQPEKTLEIVLQSPIPVPIYLAGDTNAQIFFDVLFGKLGQVNAGYFILPQKWLIGQSTPIEEEAWVYGRNEQGKINRFYHLEATTFDFPVRDFDLVEISMERNWLLNDHQPGRFPNQTFSANQLANHPSLQRIYFSSRTLIEDLKFLTELPELEELSICFDTFDKSQLVHFNAMENLKSLALFDLPSDAAIAACQNLSRLKQLTIVETRFHPPVENRQLEQWKQILPNVEIRVIPYAQYRNPSAEFQAHALKLQQKIKQRYLRQSNPDGDDANHKKID